MNKQRLLILLLSSIAGLGIAALIALSTARQDSHNALQPVTADAFGGPLTALFKHTGEKIEPGDFKGAYKIIYFGFTFCPAICPTELAKMTAALNQLGDEGGKIQPLFITVDPERDTVEAMKNYVSLFHPSLIGVTGAPDDIAQTLKDYKIYAAKVEDETMTEYTMDHSSFLYFIAPDGRLLHIFKMQDTAEQMAATMRAWLSKDGG
jgi:protein SCO1/2